MNHILLGAVLCLTCAPALQAQTAAFYTTFDANDYKTSFKDNEALIVQFKGLAPTATVSKAMYLTAYVNDKELIMYYKMDHKSEFMNIMRSTSAAEGGDQLDLILSPSQEMVTAMKAAQADQSKLTMPLMCGMTYVADQQGIHYRFAMSKLSALLPIGKEMSIKIQLEDGFINDQGAYETHKTLISGSFNYTLSKAGLEDLKTKVTTEVKAMVETVADDGITNEFHKKNVGKIVFANKVIAASDASGSTAKTSFAKLSEGIYGRVYLDKSMHNINAAVAQAHNTRNVASIEFFIDDKYAGAAAFEFKEDKNKATSWAYAAAPTATDKEFYNNMVYGFASAIKPIEAGKHKVRVEISTSYQDYPSGRWHKLMLAQGEFDVTFSTTERDAFVKANTPPPPPPCPRVKIYIQNNTSSTINYFVGGCGSSNPGTVYSKQRDHVSLAPVGGTLSINGKFFATIGAGDNERTFTVGY